MKRCGFVERFQDGLFLPAEHLHRAGDIILNR